MPLDAELDAEVGLREDSFSAGGPSAGHWWNSMLSAIEKGSLGNRLVSSGVFLYVYTHIHTYVPWHVHDCYVLVKNNNGKCVCECCAADAELEASMCQHSVQSSQQERGGIYVLQMQKRKQ